MKDRQPYSMRCKISQEKTAIQSSMQRLRCFLYHFGKHASDINQSVTEMTTDENKLKLGLKGGLGFLIKETADVLKAYYIVQNKLDL